MPFLDWMRCLCPALPAAACGRVMMAGAAAVVAHDKAQHTCWICLHGGGEGDGDGGDDAGGEEQLLRSCACRGSSGFVHLSCLITLARSKSTPHERALSWRTCPTCKQGYTGGLGLRMSRAWWGLVSDRPVEDDERLAAADHFAGQLSDIGEHAAARPLLEETLEVSRRVLGDGHVDTLSAINNLAALHHQMGDHGLARPLLEEALAARRRTLGDAHQDTLHSMNNLGLLYYETGEYTAAWPLYEEALVGMRRTLGDTHLGTMTSIGNLGMLHWCMGEHGRAGPLLQEALAAMRHTLGGAHPSTLRSLNNLGSLLRALGEHARARPLLQEAVDASRRTLGESHPFTLTSISKQHPPTSLFVGRLWGPRPADNAWIG
jgi:hypothetical protein